jgi:hypothetical protein
MRNFNSRLAAFTFISAVGSTAAAQTPSSPAPEKRAITQADRDLVNSADIEQKIAARLPKNVSEQDREKALRLAHQSVLAVRAAKGSDAAKFIGEFRRVVGGYTGPWVPCGDFCHHFLVEGNPTAYGVCYWSCVAQGGPGIKPL